MAPPRMAAKKDAISTDALASSANSWFFGKDRSVMSIETVNPMPANTATAMMSRHTTPRPSSAEVNRAVRQDPRVMPMTFPRMSPQTIPSEIG